MPKKKSDIAELSVVELKSLAYDESIKIQIAQQNIVIINQELSKRQNIKEKPKKG